MTLRKACFMTKYETAIARTLDTQLRGEVLTELADAKTCRVRNEVLKIIAVVIVDAVHNSIQAEVFAQDRFSNKACDIVKGLIYG